MSSHRFLCFGEEKLARVLEEAPTDIVADDLTQISAYSDKSATVLAGIHCIDTDQKQLKILVRSVEDVGYGYLVEPRDISNLASANDRVRPNCGFCGSPSRSMSMANSCTVTAWDRDITANEVGAEYISSEYALSEVGNITFLCDECYTLFNTIREHMFSVYSSETVPWKI